MNSRNRLQNRRFSKTIVFEHDGSQFTATVGCYPDLLVGELFLNHDRANSSLDALASDAAIVVSLALQHGADIKTIAHALRRDTHGKAASPIGAALDHVMLGSKEPTGGYRI
jgi:hypothetical protein